MAARRKAGSPELSFRRPSNPPTPARRPGLPVHPARDVQPPNHVVEPAGDPDRPTGHDQDPLVVERIDLTRQRQARQPGYVHQSFLIAQDQVRAVPLAGDAAPERVRRNGHDLPRPSGVAVRGRSGFSEWGLISARTPRLPHQEHAPRMSRMVLDSPIVRIMSRGSKRLSRPHPGQRKSTRSPWRERSPSVSSFWFAKPAFSLLP